MVNYRICLSLFIKGERHPFTDATLLVDYGSAER